MQNRKRTLSLLLSVLMLTGLLTACQKKEAVTSATGSETSKSGVPQELTVAYGKDTDVQSEKGTGDMLLKIWAGDRLVEFIDGNIQPSLAESWDINNNGKQIVFHLRKGIKFCDGTDFTSAAVKFSYDRLMNFKDTSWTEVDRISSIETPDDYTVTFNFVEGKDGYIALTSFAEYQCTIISPNATETPDDCTSRMSKYIGTGPYKETAYVKDQYTVFEPNEYYYGDKATLSKITVKILTDADARVLALQSGDVDAITDYYHGGSAYTPRNMLATLKNQGFQVISKEIPMTEAIAFNYKKSPWTDVKARQAMNYAINKADVTKLFDGWINIASNTMFASSAPYVDPSAKQLTTYDLEKATQLFQEAGLTGKTITMIANSANPDEVKLCELIQSQIQAAGVNVQLDTLESGTYSDRNKNGDYDIRIYYIGGPERRSYTRIDGRFNADAPEFGSMGYFTSPDLTAMLNEAVTSWDDPVRKAKFNEFYELADKEAAGVPLYYESIFVVSKSNVKNIAFVSSEPRFNKVTIEKNVTK